MLCDEVFQYYYIHNHKYKVYYHVNVSLISNILNISFLRIFYVNMIYFNLTFIFLLYLQNLSLGLVNFRFYIWLYILQHFSTFWFMIYASRFPIRLTILLSFVRWSLTIIFIFWILQSCFIRIYFQL